MYLVLWSLGTLNPFSAGGCRDANTICVVFFVALELGWGGNNMSRLKTAGMVEKETDGQKKEKNLPQYTTGILIIDPEMRKDKN